jgi:mannose-6-phosphate isomerase-like protein (cupin superfamily)
MNSKIASLLIRKIALKNDPALKPDGRGARKIGVTTKFDGKEHWAKETEWRGESSSTAVVDIKNTEIAVFTETTTQDRHFHKKATEIYLILEGEMAIEIENKRYSLVQGDSIIVMAKSVHEIFRETHFLAQVITVNTIGIEDKVVV